MMKNDLYEKMELLLKLDLNKDYKILDIGCGYGDLLGRLCCSINSHSTLVGIDEAENAVESAKRNYPQIDFVWEKFTDSLNFKDDSFDIVVSVDALECIPNKKALIDEVYRVLKPDGRVVFAHWDWDTQVYNSDNKSSIRKLVAAFSDWQQEWMEASDGQMGRRLWGLFESSGLFKGQVASFTLLETEYQEGKYGFDRLCDLAGLLESGKIERAEYEKVCDEMKRLSEMKKYFYSVNSYIYSGEAV